MQTDLDFDRTGLKVTNIVLCYPVLEKHVAWLEQAAPDATIINAGQERIAEAIFEADIFVGHAKVRVDWEGVVRQNRLKFIQSSAAGLDHCLVPSVIDSDITVCSASGLFADQVAEQTLALLLGLLRGLPVFFRQSLDREFIRQPTGDLHGKRIGIVGLGGNGRRLAQLLKPFRTTIAAVDYYPVKKPTEVEHLWPADQLLRLAAQSDLLILTVPLNKLTHHFIDRSVFEAMPRGSYFINVARGACVDEPALIEALQNGQLAGAGVDVTDVEPLPKESPLWSLPNVIITPHVGAQAACRVDDSTQLACENLSRYFGNQPLLNFVDKRLGFPHPNDQAIDQPQWRARFS
ncbi:MAG: D-2-hydroxyacid dehydrogenase [Pirellulaceae bacterium]|nr:D-2-hydroxyacid dehydrogenase [Pirellulaceae bacterium]